MMHGVVVLFRVSRQRQLILLPHYDLRLSCAIHNLILGNSLRPCMLVLLRRRN